MKGGSLRWHNLTISGKALTRVSAMTGPVRLPLVKTNCLTRKRITALLSNSLYRIRLSTVTRSQPCDQPWVAIGHRVRPPENDPRGPRNEWKLSLEHPGEADSCGDSRPNKGQNRQAATATDSHRTVSSISCSVRSYSLARSLIDSLP